VKLKLTVDGKSTPAMDRLAERLSRMGIVQADELRDELRRRFKENGGTFEVKP
jgi:hypothetical protein